MNTFAIANMLAFFGHVALAFATMIFFLAVRNAIKN